MQDTYFSLYFHLAHNSVSCLDRRKLGSNNFFKWLKSKVKYEHLEYYLYLVGDNAMYLQLNKECSRNNKKTVF